MLKHADHIHVHSRTSSGNAERIIGWALLAVVAIMTACLYVAITDVTGRQSAITFDQRPSMSHLFDTSSGVRRL